MTSRKDLLELYRANTGRVTHVEQPKADTAPRYQFTPARVRTYAMVEP